MDVPLWVRIGGALVVAAVVAYMATPLAIAAARRYAFYDIPAGYKAHGEPTPYLGGLAVMLAFTLALVLGAGDIGQTVPVLGGVLVMMAVGIVDDRRTVSPATRVAIEFALGVLISLAGLGWKLGASAALDTAATAVWIVAVVNAFNLFDNMDGAAGTMALVVAAGTGLLAAVTGDTWAAAGSAALCGACAGFLPHNLASPSRIFLGDGGSMPLGFVVAVLVASAARSAEASSLALLIGVLLVAIPILDTCLVIVSRRRRGTPVLSGGRDHLTHRARTRMGTAPRVAIVLGSVQAIVSALVIFASRESHVTLVYLVLGFVVCAGAAVVALESAPVAALDGEAPGGWGRKETTSTPAIRQGAGGRRRRGRAQWAVISGLLVLGLGASLSPLVHGYYDVGVWVPTGIGLTLAAAVVTIAGPPRISAPLLLVVGSLAGLGLFSLLSGEWATAVDATSTEANLWLTYAALLLLTSALLRRRLHATVLLAALGLGIGVLGLSVIVRMLGSEANSLFLGGRLNAPLGYVNGEGCVFAMGCWLALAVAERRKPLAAGLGAAATVALAGLTLLSQSRGAAIATFITMIVVLVAIPGFRRRVLAVTVVVVALVPATPLIADVYSRGQAGAPPASVVHSAAVAILLVALAAGLVWGLVVALSSGLLARGGSPAALLRRSASMLATVAVVVPFAAALIKFSSIEHTLSTQWRAFVHVSDTGTSSVGTGTGTRLLSGAGNRYDYWRIAWRAFEDHPVAGVGAGNYNQVYFHDRRTSEEVQNPHSIELQTLSELGVIGVLLLIAFVAGIGLGTWRLRRAAVRSVGTRGVMVAATGMTLAWFVDTSGDWMHLIPGVSAVALMAIAILTRGDLLHAEGPVTPERSRGFARRLAAGAAVSLMLVIAGASLVRSGLTDRYLHDARAELRTDPAAAITDADRALHLDSARLDAYYVKAAGLARFDRAAVARATLLAAARQDPNDFVTWTLLGDLEVRRGDLAAARAYYRRAQVLDPREPALKLLVADPASALKP